MNEMTKFKHDLLLRIVKVLDAALIMIPFALCWYLYYAKRVDSPFYSKGNILVVALFFVAYITFGRIYDAFRMSMQRVSEVIYAQFLAAGASDLLMYVVIWLLTKHLPNILPGVAALAGQILLAVVWAFGANKWYFSTFPPQETAVIYDVRHGMEKLISQYGMDNKYKVVLTASAEACLNDLSMLNGIKVVFLSGIHSHDRNIILKYCIANSINVFVIPRIGDTILSGARSIHMFHLPMLQVSRYSAQPDALSDVLDMEPSGKTVAFFYVTNSGSVNVRKNGDYIAKMIALAGGTYIPGNAGSDENALSTMNMDFESFYAAAKDADVLIYNSTIDGELTAIDELCAKNQLFADFKAVKEGNVWCTGKNMFQETMGLGDMIRDMNAVFADDTEYSFTYLHQLK